MRIAMRVAAAVVGLLLVALIAAAVFLPRVLASDAISERIGTAMNDAVGREVRYSELAVGLFPPSLLVEEVSVAGASPEAPALASADRIALRVALLPLLAGAVVVDSLAVDGLTVKLVRDANGIVLPKRGDPQLATAEADTAGDSFDVAIASFELNDATLQLEDRSVTPAVLWGLREVQLTARGSSASDPIDFELSLSIASGGHIDAQGTLTLDGDVDLEARLTDVAINPAGFYLEGGMGLGGQATGTLIVRGPVSDPVSIAFDGVFADGKLPMNDTTIHSGVKIAVDVAQPLSAPNGSFDLDATAAEVHYGDVFTKPAGEVATVTGKIVSAKDGHLGLDDIHLTIKNFKATAEIRTGSRTRIALDAPPFDLAGWEELIPALSEYQLSGLARIEKAVITTSPTNVRGVLVLDGVTGVLPGGEPVRIDGSLVGEGAVVNSRNLRVVAAGQTITTTLRLREVGGNIAYRVKVRTEQADTNQLISAFTSKRDFLYGLLDFDGDLRGSAGGPKPTIETLDGHLRLDIHNGRMKGVSILQLTFERLGTLGDVAVLASQLLGGPDLSPFYADDFQEISGSFDVADGDVRTDDMRIVYRDYVVDLRGRVRLADLDVDMTGSLTIGERIERALGRDRDPGAPKTIKLARVTGNLDDLDVGVSREVALAFLDFSPAGRALDRVLDDAVGEEAGALIKSILGGAVRRR